MAWALLAILIFVASIGLKYKLSRWRLTRAVRRETAVLAPVWPLSPPGPTGVIALPFGSELDELVAWYTAQGPRTPAQWRRELDIPEWPAQPAFATAPGAPSYRQLLAAGRALVAGLEAAERIGDRALHDRLLAVQADFLEDADHLLGLRLDVIGRSMQVSLEKGAFAFLLARAARTPYTPGLGNARVRLEAYLAARLSYARVIASERIWQRAVLRGLAPEMPGPCIGQPEERALQRLIVRDLDTAWDREAEFFFDRPREILERAATPAEALAALAAHEAVAFSRQTRLQLEDSPGSRVAALFDPHGVTVSGTLGVLLASGAHNLHAGYRRDQESVALGQAAAAALRGAAAVSSRHR